MNLGEYFTPVQLCWSCQKACGYCQWSELDPATKRPRFEPVPGWTAKPIRRRCGNGKNGPVFLTREEAETALAGKGGDR